MVSAWKRFPSVFLFSGQCRVSFTAAGAEPREHGSNLCVHSCHKHHPPHRSSHTAEWVLPSASAPTHPKDTQLWLPLLGLHINYNVVLFHCSLNHPPGSAAHSQSTLFFQIFTDIFLAVFVEVLQGFAAGHVFITLQRTECFSWVNYWSWMNRRNALKLVQ